MCLCVLVCDASNAMQWTCCQAFSDTVNHQLLSYHRFIHIILTILHYTILYNTIPSNHNKVLKTLTVITVITRRER